MQRYELIEGKSSKFWEVEVTGSDLTVCFGRIGTAGQSKTKNFDDEAAAIRERDKLIREKTGKGYSAVGVASVGSPSAAPATVVSQAAAPASGRAQAAAPAAVATAQVVERALQPRNPVVQHAETVPAIAWPAGGFQWKKAWREQLPPTRGIHAPAHVPTKETLADLVAFHLHHNSQVSMLETAAAAAGRSWTFWGSEVSKERITHEALARRDVEYWTELFAQARCSTWNDHSVTWVSHACVTRHGPSFALETVLAVWDAFVGWPSWKADEMFIYLRQAIACADEESYQLAFETAARLRSGSERRMQACSYFFPHIPEWAAECVEQLLAAGVSADGQRNYLLLNCAMPADVSLRYLKAKSLNYSDDLRSALCLQLHLHGEQAFDALELVFAYAIERDQSVGAVVEMLLQMRVPRLLPLLTGQVQHKKVRDALEQLASDYPAAVLHASIEQMLASRDRVIEGWTLRLALKHAAALPAALAALDEKSRTRFQAMLATLQPEEAAASDLPPLLREPPWLSKERPAELPAFDVAVLPTPQSINWTWPLQKKATEFTISQFWQRYSFPKDLGISEAGAARLLKGQPLEPDDVDRSCFVVAEETFLVPEAARLAFWNSYPVERFGAWADNVAPMSAILLKYRLDALPGLMAYMKAYPAQVAPLTDMIDSPALVDDMIHAMRFSKKHKEHAVRWVRRYSGTVLCKALPQAFHPEHSAKRDNSRHVIRWLVEQGCGDDARRIADQYGQRMRDALEVLLETSPLFMLPGVMPKLPAFFVATAFRRPQLTSGGALPVAALEYLGSMLAISQPDAPYAGIAIVKDACTRESLAEFAWDIFEAWLAGGAGGKDGFAFKALALLGNDDTARRLAPHIRAWPDQSAPARALAGLDVLAALGTDVALMYLNGLATKGKNKPVLKRAAALIATVADSRGLSTDELADRLVPDLGLDEAGALVLDFGPRTFNLRFDETLEPFVTDAQGVRLKTLPRQVKTDDPALAAPAVARFKQMRTEARATAALQVARMERAMVARRRWPVADFRLFFLEHPLMRHLTARVVWGVYEENRLAQVFRVAEDWTLADADDKHWELPQEGTIGIPHLLDMAPADRAAFLQMFGDYEIAQPFKQLGRETYALTADELQRDTITRFKDKVVYIGSIMGLVHRGWVRGDVESMVESYVRDANDTLQIELRIAPGFYIGDMTSEPRQCMPAVRLHRCPDSGAKTLAPFSELDPMLASEMLRDLDLLSPAKE